MSNKLYPFLKRNERFYSLQFKFKQQHSDIFALIYLTKKIRNYLDDLNNGCDILLLFRRLFLLQDIKSSNKTRTSQKKVNL